MNRKTNFFFKKKVPNVYNESETITKFEIMDGAPVRGTWDLNKKGK